jgi:hypothetical protein
LSEPEPGRIALRLRLRPKDAAPCGSGSGSATLVLFSAVDSDTVALDPDLDVWDQIRILALMTQYQFFGVFKSHKYF